MNDESALLNQLRLERPAAASSSSPTHRRMVAVLVGAILLTVAAAVYAFVRPRSVPIKVAVARAVQSSSVARASTLDASGYVIARRQATVSAKITGKVLAVSVEEGEHVNADQEIARLDDANYRTAYEQALAQLAQSVSSVQAAQVSLADAQPIFERNRKLVAQGLMSAQAFDNAKASFHAIESALTLAERTQEVARRAVKTAEQSLADCVVRAPYAGVVTARAAQAGEIVSPISAGGGFTRTGIGTIVDMDSLEVAVDVSESFINRVRPQQPASIRLNAYPDWDIAGEVLAVVPTADRAKATVKVRVAFKDKDPRILPEMGARVSFLDEQRNAASAAAASPAVAVPREAAQITGDTAVVFVVSDETVERRVLSVAEQPADGSVVLRGLPPGARLALGDLQSLRDHTRVRVTQ